MRAKEIEIGKDYVTTFGYIATVHQIDGRYCRVTWKTGPDAGRYGDQHWTVTARIRTPC